MTPELSELYQQIILDHNRSPRNFGPLEGANRSAEGFNPVCGDHFTIRLKLEGDRIEAVRFEGAGCAISKASASLMTSAVEGKTTAEVAGLVDRFRGVVTGPPPAPDTLKSLGRLAALAGVRAFPRPVSTE
jgi:nitrogen fixation NifU-like protein